jgi:hypothetical protein
MTIVVSGFGVFCALVFVILASKGPDNTPSKRDLERYAEWKEQAQAAADERMRREFRR